MRAARRRCEHSSREAAGRRGRGRDRRAARRGAASARASRSSGPPPAQAGAGRARARPRPARPAPARHRRARGLPPAARALARPDHRRHAPAARRSTASSGSSSARTTTSSSRTACASWSPASARSCGALEPGTAGRAGPRRRPRGRPARTARPARRAGAGADPARVRPARAARVRPGRGVLARPHLRGGLGNALVRLGEGDRRPRRGAAQEARRPALDRDRSRGRLPASRLMSRRLLLSYLTVTLLVARGARGPARRHVLPQRAPRPRDEGRARRRHGRVPLRGGAGGNGRGVAGVAARDCASATSVTPAGAWWSSTVADSAIVDSSPIPGDTELREPARDRVRARRVGWRRGVRHSNTLGVDLLYVAVPVASAGRILGAARITYPTSAVDRRVTPLLADPGGDRGHRAGGRRAARAVDRARRGRGRCDSSRRRRPRSARGDSRCGLPRKAPRRCGVSRGSSTTRAAKLERLIASQQAFVADASHELRTPLTALRLRLENVDGEASAPALAEVERLGRLVESLLALARADAAAVNSEPVDVDSVLADRLRQWEGVDRRGRARSARPQLARPARPDRGQPGRQCDRRLRLGGRERDPRTAAGSSFTSSTTAPGSPRRSAGGPSTGSGAGPGRARGRASGSRSCAGWRPRTAARPSCALPRVAASTPSSG